MTAQTFRYAAKLSPSGHSLLDRLLDTLALLHNACLEESTHALRMAGRNITSHDRFGSLTAIRKADSV